MAIIKIQKSIKRKNLQNKYATSSEKWDLIEFEKFNSFPHNKNDTSKSLKKNKWRKEEDFSKQSARTSKY